MGGDDIILEEVLHKTKEAMEGLIPLHLVIQTYTTLFSIAIFFIKEGIFYIGISITPWKVFSPPLLLLSLLAFTYHHVECKLALWRKGVINNQKDKGSLAVFWVGYF